jgi:predicted  nucleic acid-binding Zn-ribbon protein
MRLRERANKAVSHHVEMQLRDRLAEANERIAHLDEEIAALHTTLATLQAATAEMSATFADRIQALESEYLAVRNQRPEGS